MTPEQVRDFVRDMIRKAEAGELSEPLATMIKASVAKERARQAARLKANPE